MNAPLHSALAHTHRERLAAEGGRSRLAALAAYCRRSLWRTAADGFLAFMRKGQLGPGYQRDCCA